MNFILGLLFGLLARQAKGEKPPPGVEIPPGGAGWPWPTPGGGGPPQAPPGTWPSWPASWPAGFPWGQPGSPPAGNKPPPPDGGGLPFPVEIPPVFGKFPGGPPGGAPPGGAPPGGVVVPTAYTYTIKSGDYPSGLAAKATGNGGRWRELLAANPEMTTYQDAKGQTQIKPWNVGYTFKVPPGWNLPGMKGG